MKFSIFSIFALLAAIHSTTAGKFRVYHGQDVVPVAFDQYGQPISRSKGEFPYIVSIEYQGRHNCGGAILTPDVIVTAGHCVEDFKPIFLTVRAGHVVREENSPNVQVLKVKFYEIHPKYTGFTYDIALVKLEGSFVHTRFVRPIPMARKSDSYYGQKGTLIGWGKTQHLTGAQFLQKADIEIIPDDECAYRTLSNSISESEICGFDREREMSGICSGDSGGPFVIHHADKPWEDVLVGLSSHGSVSGSGCDTKRPSVFANIANLEDWIIETYHSKFA